MVFEIFKVLRFTAKSTVNFVKKLMEISGFIKWDTLSILWLFDFVYPVLADLIMK